MCSISNVDWDERLSFFKVKIQRAAPAIDEGTDAADDGSQFVRELVDLEALAEAGQFVREVVQCSEKVGLFMDWGLMGILADPDPEVDSELVLDSTCFSLGDGFVFPLVAQMFNDGSLYVCFSVEKAGTDILIGFDGDMLAGCFNSTDNFKLVWSQVESSWS